MYAILIYLSGTYKTLLLRTHTIHTRTHTHTGQLRVTPPL